MIVIAPDKFKGSLGALEAAEAIAAGLRRGGCREELRLVPMADGGEGMPSSIDGFPVVSTSRLVGTANRALASLDVFDRSSAPLGEALTRLYGPQVSGAPERIWVAVGGTLTVDGGAGALQAMGIRFRDRNGRPMEEEITAARLNDLSPLRPEDLRDFDLPYWRKRLHLLCDVEATLTGPGLSSLDFAPQKGVAEEKLPQLKQGLENLRRVLGSPASSPADGAGGGIGFAFGSFTGAPVSGGAEVMISHQNIDWKRVTLVISGEGRIDTQTAGGKVVETMRKEAAKRGIPFVAIGGYTLPELRDSHTLSTIERPEDYTAEFARERLEEAAERIGG